MYLRILEWSMIFAGLTLGALITFQKLIICKLKNDIVANYVPFIAFAMLFYIVVALLLAIATRGTINKVVTFLFAISPFAIGRFVTYKTESLFSYVQVLCAFFSSAYTFLVLM